MRESIWKRRGALRLFAAAGLVVAFAGCKKEEAPSNYTPPQTFSISGTVTGDVVKDVTVRVLGGSRSALTNQSGAYTISGLPAGTYEIEASLDRYSFTPPTRSVTLVDASVTGQDFVAVLGLAIAGKVEGAGAGVTVTLTGPLPATTTTVVETATDGSYEFFGVDAGEYSVAPSLAGGWKFSPADCRVTVAQTSVTGPDFTAIPPVHALSGKIAGAVSAGVTVVLSGDADAVAVSDDSGNYSFAGLAPGSYVVTLSRQGVLFDPPQRSVLIGDADVTGQDFSSVATHRIAGWITGDVLVGAKVTLTSAGSVSRTATTNAVGYFELREVPDGDYVVTPELAGFSFDPTTRSVTLAGADVTDASFAATRAPSIAVSGRVSGDVVAGVTVTLTGATTVAAVTDAAGDFVFNGVAPGDYMLIPSLEDYEIAPSSRLVSVGAASVGGQDFTLTLSPTARIISGTVSGAATSDVTVELIGISPVAAPVTVLTDATGGFAFHGLGDGLYLVTPTLAGGYGFTPANCLVTVAGPSVTSLAFTAAAVPHVISGKVSGAVAAGVIMSLSGTASAVTVTAADGTYAFVDVWNGLYIVTPSLDGYAFGPQSAGVTLEGADATGVDFVAVATHRIAGTISGDVVEGVTVALSGAKATLTTTDALGSYEFTGLPDGAYVVTAAREGYAFDPEERAIDLAGADVTTADFTATLVPTYSVSGTIGGVVAGGVTVTLSGAASASTTTDDAGFYVFTGLHDGSYMVIPSVLGFAFDPASRAFRVNGADVGAQDFTSRAAP